MAQQGKVGDKLVTFDIEVTCGAQSSVEELGEPAKEEEERLKVGRDSWEGDSTLLASAICGNRPILAID